jgi:hypothetical protein
MPYYTHYKYKGTDHYVCVDVLSDAVTNESYITHITSIGALTTMYTSMYYQTALLSEGPITHITSITALTTMYVSMCYETALQTECLITHITNIRALTMGALMLSDSPFE